MYSTTGNPRGTFTFTGASTACDPGAAAAQCGGSGYDFADFLLGLPQRTTIAYGANRFEFHSIAYNFFVQDDWRWRGNMTFNLGLRYEYTSPVTEANDRLVSLDVTPDFTAVAPVFPGDTGPLSGIRFPRSLVKPNRRNFGPAIGMAWRGAGRFVVRTGYRISYNGGVYNAMANQFVRQPPFAVTQTNMTSALTPLTLQNGFPPPQPGEVTNTFGVEPNYRVGYAHQWNLAIQRDLRPSLQMTLDYTETRGVHLDIAQAPNRTLTGLRIPNVQPFTWETSNGNSYYHGGSLTLQRRLSRGISFGGTYTYSKMIDDASSFTGGGAGIAQDAFNLRAERSVSNNDQRHVLSVNYNAELPFGPNRTWLRRNTALSRLAGGWTIGGTVNLGSGRPFTPTATGSRCDINRGTNSTLRADYNGARISLDNPTADRWFNVDAFSDPTASGCTHYGTAGRNIIRGPGTRSVNMTLNKSFRIKDNRNLDVRLQANNVFNMVNYSQINTTVNSTLFGQVMNASQMRRITIQARYRF